MANILSGLVRDYKLDVMRVENIDYFAKCFLGRDK